MSSFLSNMNESWACIRVRAGGIIVWFTLIVLQVLEQREDAWRGVVISDGRRAKPGYFPPDTVVLLDSSGETVCTGKSLCIYYYYHLNKIQLNCKTSWEFVEFKSFQHWIFLWNPKKRKIHVPIVCYGINYSIRILESLIWEYTRRSMLIIMWKLDVHYLDNLVS